MKTRCSPDSHGVRLLRLLPALALLFFLPHALSAAGGPPPVKPYTLYLGANLIVEWHGKLWPVRGVQRDSFVIDADGRRVRVPDTDLRMKIDRTLKLSTTYAKVAEVKGERAYTPANDPRHYVHDAMMVGSETSDNLDLAQYTMNTVGDNLARSVAEIPPRADHFPMGPINSLQQQSAQASDSFQNAVSNQGSEITSVSDAMDREQTKLAQKLFDAFRLSFDISSRQTLTDPYVVIMVRFRDHGGDPKTTRLLVYARKLSTVDERPQTVRLLRGGFPRGYELEDYQIHLYDHGTEIATSAAPNKMAMTTDEAFQYTVADYVVRNRGKTLPPAPAKAFWPKDLSKHLPASELNRPIYVKVGVNGKVAGFYDNQACTRPDRDADLDAVRPELRFQPALEKGKPVEGVVEFNLGRRIE